MGFYRTEGEYLDIILAVLKKLGQQRYQLASFNLSQISESAYVYLLKDRNQLIRLRLSAHSDHINRSFSTLLIKTNISDDTRLIDMITEQVQSCNERLYSKLTPKMLTLLEFINTSTFKTHQGKLYIDVLNNRVLVKYPTKSLEFDYSDFRDEIRVCVDLNLLRSGLFSKQHMLQTSLTGREVLRMFVRLQSLKLETLMSQMQAYTDIHKATQDHEITISKTSNYRLKQWRSSVIQVAKQIKFRDHWFCFAADSLPRQKWVNLYFTNLDRIVVLRVGEQLYDYTPNGLNRQDNAHFVQLSTKSTINEITQALQSFNFELAQSIKISYQLMVTCQLLMQLEKNKKQLAGDPLINTNGLKKHYRRDLYTRMFDNIVISNSSMQFSSDHVINRYLVLLSQACLIDSDRQRITCREPLKILLAQYQNVAEFKQSSVWRRDISKMTVNDCIDELEKLSSKNPIIS